MRENQHIEFKESWRDEYLKWICGFANAAGGVLIIGRNDRGEAVGVSDATKLLEDLPNKIRLDGEKLFVDLNHPLAGESLTFEIEVVGISSTATQSHAGCGCGSGCDCSSGSC